jgi:hypothetical protein
MLCNPEAQPPNLISALSGIRGTFLRSMGFGGVEEAVRMTVPNGALEEVSHKRNHILTTSFDHELSILSINIPMPNGFEKNQLLPSIPLHMT